MELTFLDARQGDAIWVRWGEGRQLLVDMGTSGTGRALADRFRALPEDQRAFELLVVTHVDTDHIGGVLTGLVDPAEPVPVTFADVWFNGWEHLNGLVPADERSALEPMGGVQGELLTTWLRDHAWNDAFGRAAVVRTDTTLPRVELPDGLTITVLAPVQERLTELVPEWQLAVAAALEKGTLTDVSPGLEPMGPSTAPTLESAVDLALLSEDPFKVDGSKANAASIALVLEHDGKRALLTGDATASELLGGLALLGAGERVPLDLVKLPHHGSRNNVSRAAGPGRRLPALGVLERRHDVPAPGRDRGLARRPRRGPGAAPGVQRAQHVQPVVGTVRVAGPVRLHHDVRRRGRRCDGRPLLRSGPVEPAQQQEEHHEAEHQHDHADDRTDEGAALLGRHRGRRPRGAANRRPRPARPSRGRRRG